LIVVIWSKRKASCTRFGDECSKIHAICSFVRFNIFFLKVKNELY